MLVVDIVHLLVIPRLAMTDPPCFEHKQFLNAFIYALYNHSMACHVEADAGGFGSTSPPSRISRFAKGVDPSRGFATGSQADNFGFVLCICQSWLQMRNGTDGTDVEYGRYAALLCVMLIFGAGGSHGRMPGERSLSSEGGLSTM